MEKLLFGDLEDCLNPVEELLDGLQSAMEEFCENFEYSGAAEPLFRKSGNRLSGIGNRHVA